MRVGPVDVIYIDFTLSKASDKVPHSRLLHKIRMHGINSKLIVWIQHWHTDRRQRVVVEGQYSGCNQWSSAGKCARTSVACDISKLLVCQYRWVG